MSSTDEENVTGRKGKKILRKGNFIIVENILSEADLEEIRKLKIIYSIKCTDGDDEGRKKVFTGLPKNPTGFEGVVLSKQTSQERLDFVLSSDLVWPMQG